MACLRIDVSAYSGKMPMSVLAPLVQKFAGAYLETRWSWPRRFVPLTEFSFLLTDSRSDELDVSELRRLSDQLQHHLFGVGDEGEVALLVFEGSHTAVTAFAAMDAKAVAAAVADPDLLPPGGRLTRIVAGGAEGEPEEPAARNRGERGWETGPARARGLNLEEPEPVSTAWEGVQGIYFTPREVFVGDVVTYIPANGKSHLSLVDGPEHLPKDPVAFDAACMGIATRLLGQRAKGPPLYLPISFTSLVRPSLRGAYEAMLSSLPPERRDELAVSIYDVPRDPAFTGLKQARALLDPHVSVIDLRVTDPGFEIEKLPLEAATSVTLMLPEGDGHVRLSALKRFAERLTHYKQRRIWPAVTNVRRRAEMEAAARLHIPFLTGPAICSPVPSPVGGRAVPSAHLPLSLGDWMNLRDRGAPSAA